MISLILLVQYLVEALNEPRVQPEEDNPESNATGRAKCGQSEKEIPIGTSLELMTSGSP
jgi:hypothetical protein